jgi:hypothetical protein
MYSITPSSSSPGSILIDASGTAAPNRATLGARMRNRDNADRWLVWRRATSQGPGGKRAAVKDVLDDIEQWQGAGHRVALARVVAVSGSGPREPGAAMAVNDEGRVAGSVSGGCVEGAVVAEALEVLASGQPRLCTFGFSDEDAFSVGLTCGGTVRIFVEPLD